ncbi:MAG: AAA family ATPase, partial [Bacteroidota bacterium]
MIKQVKVKNLNSKISGTYNFNEDLNILTGKNGCGKTTLLKLIWYVASGNFDRIFEEM